VNHTANIDTIEVEKFSSIAQQWWDPSGPCAPLHALNPCRLQFIKQTCVLKGMSILDIGCGAGILTESLAVEGAQVTGIDASPEVIEAAQQHAVENNLSIDYRHMSSEDLRVSEQRFDIITCMELLEHVPDPIKLIEDCYALLKPGGKLFLSTLNRNIKAYALAIIGAEYLLKILPARTHDYAKFIRPSELAATLRSAQFNVQELAGISYNPLTKSATLCPNVDVNYLVQATKEI